MSDRPHAANDGSVPPEWQPVQSCIRPRALGAERRLSTILPPPLAAVPDGAVAHDEAFAGYTPRQRARARRVELERWLLEHLPAPRPVVERHPELVPAAARLALVR